MRLRYKKTLTETSGSHFNMSACMPDEVLTGNDTVPVPELDVWINNEWKDLRQAFKDHDIIVDNYNTCFFPPPTEEDRKRGYTE